MLIYAQIIVMLKWIVSGPRKAYSAQRVTGKDKDVGNAMQVLGNF